jgi:hypothetical protein
MLAHVLTSQAWFVQHFPFQILNLESIFINLDGIFGFRVAGARKFVINSWRECGVSRRARRRKPRGACNAGLVSHLERSKIAAEPRNTLKTRKRRNRDRTTDDTDGTDKKVEGMSKESIHSDLILCALSVPSVQWVVQNQFGCGGALQNAATGG